MLNEWPAFLDLHGRQPAMTYLAFCNGLDELRRHQGIAFKTFRNQESCRQRTQPKRYHADEKEAGDRKPPQEIELFSGRDRVSCPAVETLMQYVDCRHREYSWACCEVPATSTTQPSPAVTAFFMPKVYCG
jgi:hypothetical protein